MHLHHLITGPKQCSLTCNLNLWNTWSWFRRRYFVTIVVVVANSARIPTCHLSLFIELKCWNGTGRLQSVMSVSFISCGGFQGNHILDCSCWISWSTVWKLRRITTRHGIKITNARHTMTNAENSLWFNLTSILRYIIMSCKIILHHCRLYTSHNKILRNSRFHWSKTLGHSCFHINCRFHWI